MTQPEGTRTPVSSRLEGLFPQSGSSTPRQPPAPSDDDMPLPRPGSAAGRSFETHRRAQHSIPPRLHPTPPQPAPMSAASQTLPSPVLRWLNGKRKSDSPSSSRPDSPSSPSSSHSALSEALNEDMLPARPVPARLPQGFYPSTQLSRHPPYFDNLTRSTLPTASLSPPESAVSPDTIFLNDDGHGRRRSSIDTLKSLHERGMHTSATRRLQESPPSQWNWFQWSNKAQTDHLLSEEDQQVSDQEEREHINKKYRTPHHPLVFCHGLLGFDSVSIGPSIAPMEVTHWRGIKEVLEANGCEVLITRVPATSSPQDRAKVLEQRISEIYPGRKVHLIGHSMGGLDCRYLTTHLTHRKFEVASITTIASPHRGSYFADHFLSLVGTSRLPSVLGLLDMLPNGGGDGKAFECLTVANMKKFNEETPDVDGVKYFSWGATYTPGLIDTWKYSHDVVYEKEGPNDGLVSVESSKWGTYLGTLENVNHLDLVGWTNVARYRWASIMGREIKFKPATFYLGIADHLATVVEEQPSGSSSAGGNYQEGPAHARARRVGLERRRTSGEERAVMAENLASNRTPTASREKKSSGCEGEPFVDDSARSTGVATAGHATAVDDTGMATRRPRRSDERQDSDTI